MTQTPAIDLADATDFELVSAGRAALQAEGSTLTALRTMVRAIDTRCTARSIHIGRNGGCLEDFDLLEDFELLGEVSQLLAFEIHIAELAEKAARFPC